MRHIPKHWPTEYSFHACSTCEFCGQKAKIKENLRAFTILLQFLFYIILYYSILYYIILYYTILFYIMFLEDNPALKR